MSRKIMIIVTNNDNKVGGKKTGWYLPEVAHPYDVFTKAGFDVTFVSPNGGKAPMDEGSYEAFKEDPSSKKFYNEKVKDNALKDTLKPSQVTASDYEAIVYAGGHGPMFDLPQATDVNKLCSKMYEDGRIVGAVCHGTVGLLNVKLQGGKNMIDGKYVTSFTNDEEDVVQLTKEMPFKLETELVNKGAKFVRVKDFQENVQVDGKIVTGQNPASASKMAEKIVELLQKK